MDTETLIEVEVAYAGLYQQKMLKVKLDSDSLLKEAIMKSKILEFLSELLT